MEYWQGQNTAMMEIQKIMMDAQAVIALQLQTAQ
jgi:hypothetical protein